MGFGDTWQNMMAVRGDVQVNNPILTHQGCILISMTFINVTWQSGHDYVANGWWPGGSYHGYKVIYCNFPLLCSSMLQVGGKHNTQSYSCSNIHTVQWWMCDHTNNQISLVFLITTPWDKVLVPIGLCCLQFLGSYTLYKTWSVVIYMLWHQVGRGLGWYPSIIAFIVYIYP